MKKVSKERAQIFVLERKENYLYKEMLFTENYNIWNE